MGFNDRIDKLGLLPPEVREEIKARNAAFGAKTAAKMAEMNSRFYAADTVMGIYRDAKGQIPETAFSIAKFQNDAGDTVYCRRGNQEEYPSSDVVKELSIRIKTQQADFTKLDPTEQSRILKEALSGKTDPRFGDHLSNEANKQYFIQLKSGR